MTLFSKQHLSFKTEHQLEKFIQDDDEDSLLNLLNTNNISPNYCFSSFHLFEPLILRNNPS